MKVINDDLYVVKLSGSDIGVNTTPYGDNDLVGERVTKSNVVPGGAKVMPVSVLIRDLTNQKAALDLIIFNGTPSNGTYTNNGALDIDDTDFLQVVGRIAIAAADYKSYADNAVGIVRPTNTASVFEADADGTLSFMLNSNSATPTYAANELSLEIAFAVQP